MSYFEGIVVNHASNASREMLGRIYILEDAKFPCQVLASVISLTLQSKVFITFESTRIDFVMVSGYLIGDNNCKHLLFMNTGQVHF